MHVYLLKAADIDNVGCHDFVWVIDRKRSWVAGGGTVAVLCMYVGKWYLVVPVMFHSAVSSSSSGCVWRLVGARRSFVDLDASRYCTNAGITATPGQVSWRLAYAKANASLESRKRK
jgi:hypothetical protein